jgi:hypothetical protein
MYSSATSESLLLLYPDKYVCANSESLLLSASIYVVLPLQARSLHKSQVGYLFLTVVVIDFSGLNLRTKFI